MLCHAYCRAIRRVCLPLTMASVQLTALPAYPVQLKAQRVSTMFHLLLIATIIIPSQHQSKKEGAGEGGRVGRLNGNIKWRDKLLRLGFQPALMQS